MLINSIALNAFAVEQLTKLSIFFAKMQGYINNETQLFKCVLECSQCACIQIKHTIYSTVNFVKCVKMYLSCAFVHVDLKTVNM